MAEVIPETCSRKGEVCHSVLVDWMRDYSSEADGFSDLSAHSHYITMA